MKRFCCIGPVSSHDSEFFYVVRKYTKVQIDWLRPSDSVEEYDVVVFVLSEEVLSNEKIKQLKEASDLNKIFLPVILGGNWWKSWLLKRRYKGPDLRTPFFELRKEAQMIEFLRQVASYGGSKICGDIYGSVFEFNVDLDCKVFRNKELIAETENSHDIKIVLCKGVHKLEFQSIEYPEMSEVVRVKVKNYTSEIKMDVKIKKRRYVKKERFRDGFYEGSLLLDVRDGEGTFWFPNGDVYKGFWRNDVISGKGLMEYSSGKTYYGDWVDGKPQGVGKFTWRNKDFYEGEFMHGEICGKGIKRYGNGSYYDGLWKNGFYHGKGTKRFADGSIYCGDWQYGKRQGYGNLTFRNGDCYEGEFYNGNISGSGKMCYRDGSYYDGLWSNGYYHGKGTKRFADGWKYVGKWENGGIQYGHGILYDSKGNEVCIVKIKTTIDCSIFENEQFIANIKSTEESLVYLTLGTHKLKFEHGGLIRYITISAKPGEGNKSIFYEFPYSPRETTDN